VAGVIVFIIAAALAAVALGAWVFVRVRGKRAKGGRRY
jgi:uncharacterized membrane protein